MSFSIPVIDLPLVDSLNTRVSLLVELRYALLDVGCVYVTNHGIPHMRDIR